MNKLFFTYLFCLSIFAFGQNDSLQVNLLKVSPLHLFDLDNGLSFSWERTLRNRTSFNLEAGYGNSSLNLWTSLFNEGQDYERFANYNLLRTRLEWRGYFKNSKETAPEGSYYGYELLGKYVFSSKEFTVGRDPIGGQPQYFQKVNGKVKKWVSGFHVKLGKQWLISDLSSDKQWFADVFGGIGFRMVLNTFDYRGKEPSDIVSVRNSFSFGTIFRRQDQIIPVVSGSFGLRIGRKF